MPNLAKKNLGQKVNALSLFPPPFRDETEDDLSELQSEAVPDEVRKWLASTFAKQEPPTRRSQERPSFKSVANAIRTGIFIERIYRRMSSSQLMVIPPEVQKCLKVSLKKDINDFLEVLFFPVSDTLPFSSVKSLHKSMTIYRSELGGGSLGG